MADRLRIGLLCATRRGWRVLGRLTELLPQSCVVVASFREEPGEPAFFEDIRERALASGGAFVEAARTDVPALREFWESADLDLMLVVSWRTLVPAAIYRLPRLGTFVFHDSMLPRYRGFSPTVWAIVNGEDHTGVTLFRMAEDVDSGAIIAQRPVPIGPDETIATVMERVTLAYLAILEEEIGTLVTGPGPGRPQDEGQATYACKRVAEDNEIRWAWPTRRVYDLIRGVSAPYPGAYSYLGGRRIRVWAARRMPAQRRYEGRVPGRVVDTLPGQGSVVLTGDGSLLLTEVALDGAGVVCASEVLNRRTQTLGR